MPLNRGSRLRVSSFKYVTVDSKRHQPAERRARLRLPAPGQARRWPGGGFTEPGPDAGQVGSGIGAGPGLAGPGGGPAAASGPGYRTRRGSGPEKPWPRQQQRRGRSRPAATVSAVACAVSLPASLCKAQ